MPPGRGSAAGRNFLAPPYYSQRAVFVSPLSAFFINVVIQFAFHSAWKPSDGFFRVKITMGTGTTVAGLGYGHNLTGLEIGTLLQPHPRVGL